MTDQQLAKEAEIFAQSFVVIYEEIGQAIINDLSVSRLDLYGDVGMEESFVSKEAITIDCDIWDMI